MVYNAFLLLALTFQIILLKSSYKNNHHDLLAPSVGTFFVFAISMIFALYGNIYWKKQFEISTFFVVSIGSVVIYCVDLLTTRKYRNKSLKKSNVFCELKRIQLSTSKVILVTIISVVITSIYVISIKKLGKENVNFIAKQGIKFIMAAGYVNTFIFINNILSKSVKKIDAFLIIPFFCGCLCSFYTGVRTEILRLMIAAFVFFIVLMKEKKGWRNNDSEVRQVVKKSLLPISAFLIIFFLMRTVIKEGDVGENTNYGFMMYISFYIGSPWIVLNQKIFLGLENYKGNMWGHLTFANLWSDLKDLGLYSGNIDKVKTFTSIDAASKVSGNVDTILGSPLIDFGIIGMALTLSFIYFFLTHFYNTKIKYSYSTDKRNLQLVLYSFFYYIVGLSFYSCGLTFILSMYYLLTIVFILAIWKFYFSFVDLKVVI